VEPLQRARPSRRAPARFPLSNWTELDVWQYIAEEGLEVPTSTSPTSARSSARRDAVRGLDHVELLPGEEPFTESVRYRTVGDMSCTGAVRLAGGSLEEVVRRSPPRASPSAARPGPTTACRRPPWRTGRWPAISELLRLATAGSVDDGKSTLIGRLLYDTKSILADQLEQVEEASRRRGGDGALDLSLLTDGPARRARAGDHDRRRLPLLRHAAALVHPRRHPGHVQYTRNMVTGASTADLAIILVDARHGVVEQTRRHAVIASLLGIRRLVVAVNKMDLVDWDEATFDGSCASSPRSGAPARGAGDLHPALRAARRQRGEPLGAPDLVRRAVAARAPRGGARRRGPPGRPALPVQWVIRPGADIDVDFRGYAGQVASGVVAPATGSSCCPPGRGRGSRPSTPTTALWPRRLPACR
jgi:hypothetical protein